MPARRKTFQTVEWAKPVAPPTSRGPQPVARRHAQIISASSGANCRGERPGRLERSHRHDSVVRASALASRQRCHQRLAVAGETLKAPAAAFHERPPSTARTNARRPASPSLALACRYIPALLRESWQTHSLEGGPDRTVSRSQPV